MFISRKTIFNDYAKWLFEILFNLENNINKGGAQYQPRIYGFVAERLFNVYFHYLINSQNIKYKELDVKYL